jgi:hypothetical protein
VQAWSSALIASAAFYVLVTAGSALVRWAFSGYAAAGLRASATLRLTGSVVGQVSSALLLIVYLR